jgi:hypothetical protein
LRGKEISCFAGEVTEPSIFSKSHFTDFDTNFPFISPNLAIVKELLEEVFPYLKLKAL